MPTATSLRRPLSQPDSEGSESFPESAAAPWLSIVADKVKNIRYGVVQIVVHDSKVVQIERTERTRFEVPPATR
jgi:hypothetical protein